MSHDFAKTGNRKRRKAKSKPVLSMAGFWYLSGLVSGLFISFLLYMAIGIPNSQPVTASPDTRIKQQIEQKVSEIESAKQVSQKTPDSEESSQLQFEFYTILPDKEVKVAADAGSDRPEGDEADSANYLLQAGSFRSMEDAEQRRAELLLLGLDTRVQTVRNANSVWHRVQVGPFSSNRRLNQARNLLTRHHIESLVLRMK